MPLTRFQNCDNLRGNYRRPLMKNRLTVIFAIGILLVLSNYCFVLAQEETKAPEPAAPAAAEPETQWLFGEVTFVDTVNNAITVKTLDYETDQEKEVVMAVDDKTTYEGVNALAQINPASTVSVDYIVNSEGKSCAKNISVEKTEAAVPAVVTPPAQTLEEAPQAPAETTAQPQDMPPAAVDSTSTAQPAAEQ
jgi:hypothetical protein